MPRSDVPRRGWLRNTRDSPELAQMVPDRGTSPDAPAP